MIFSILTSMFFETICLSSILISEKFTKVLKEQQEARRDREIQRIRLLSADPFDMEAQRAIANEIKQEVSLT